MKKINLIKAALLFVSVLSLSSCSSDDSGESNGTTTGDYWPMKLNNTWNFDASGNTEQLKMIGTDEFGGTTYYELQDDGDTSGFDTEYWVGKKGATYYQKIADINTIQNGVTINIKGYQIPMFKDDLAVNETWSGSVRPRVTYSYNGQNGSLPTTVAYTGRILERDATEVVNGVTYPNVIKVSIDIDTNVDGQINTVESEYWFAKDVGPIKESQAIDGGTTTVRTLTNFTLN